MSPFCGLLIPLFWTSGNICPGFQSQGRSLRLHTSSPAHNGFLRFTSGVTPADLLAASMAAKLFHPQTCIQALVRLKSRIKRVTTSQHVTKQMLRRLCEIENSIMP